MSPAPVSLRRRVTIGFTVMGFVLSSVFAVAAIAITEDYEHVLAAEILRGQAEDYSLRMSTSDGAALPETHRLSGYLDRDVPERYSRFPPGVSEDEEGDGDGIHVGVFDTTAGRLTFVVDLSDIEQLELHLNLFLAIMVVAGTLCAGWLGWLLSGAALAPLARLADAVDALPAQPERTRLKDGTSHDELGRLAGAIDAYQVRLKEADEAERAFFADASHELRTPIAVVQGVAEVLLDGVAADPAQAPRLRRLERGVQELADLIDTMLCIARRRPLSPEPCGAADLLGQAVSPLLSAHGVSSVDIEAGTDILLLPRREALLLLRGLLRPLLSPGEGTLALRGRPGCIELIFRGREAPTASAADRTDLGGTPVLVLRLARRLGWALDWPEPGHVRISLP